MAELGEPVTGQQLVLAAAAVGAGGWGSRVGTVPLAGVLAQLALVVMLYVAPMLRGRDFAQRDRMARTFRDLRAHPGWSLNLGVA